MFSFLDKLKKRSVTTGKFVWAAILLIGIANERDPNAPDDEKDLIPLHNYGRIECEKHTTHKYVFNRFNPVECQAPSLAFHSQQAFWQIYAVGGCRNRGSWCTCKVNKGNVRVVNDDHQYCTWSRLATLDQANIGDTLWSYQTILRVSELILNIMLMLSKLQSWFSGPGSSVWFWIIDPGPV